MANCDCGYISFVQLTAYVVHQSGKCTKPIQLIRFDTKEMPRRQSLLLIVNMKAVESQCSNADAIHTS